MAYSLILLNGGVGSRTGHSEPKQFIKVNGLPILVYSLVVVDHIKEIDEIIINYPSGWLEDVKNIVENYAIKTPIKYIECGSSRHESVSKMIDVCRNDKVIIHESARPLVNADDFNGLINDARDNVSLMSPISFTVAPVDPTSTEVTGMLDRSLLRNVQLPQKFSKKDLLEAHRYAQKMSIEFTEDATLCAVAGKKVYFKNGTDKNIKVTTKTDIHIAGFLLSGDDKNE